MLRFKDSRLRSIVIGSTLYTVTFFFSVHFVRLLTTQIVCIKRAQSCVSKQYVQNAESQVVNTGWALLSLMKAEYPDPEPIKRCIKYLLSKQKKDGHGGHCRETVVSAW